MIVIADSNILVSGLYAPGGVIAQILTDPKNSTQFIAPDFVITEIRAHREEITRYKGFTKKQFTLELKRLTANITFFDILNIPQHHIHEAIAIVCDIDIDDTFFLLLSICTQDTRFGRATEFS